MNIPVSPCVPENLVSRDGFSRPVPRQPAHLHTQAESGAYLRDSSRVPRRPPFMKPPYAIGSVPSLSGHAIAYRWCSLPRVRRNRASKPQGSSERVLPWQITMDQLIFASLSHTHYWYEVGMLKVPVYSITVGFSPISCHWERAQLNPMKTFCFCRLFSHLDVLTLSPRYFRVGPNQLLHPTIDLGSPILEPDTKHNIFFFSAWTFVSAHSVLVRIVRSKGPAYISDFDNSMYVSVSLGRP